MFEKAPKPDLEKGEEQAWQKPHPELKTNTWEAIRSNKNIYFIFYGLIAVVIAGILILLVVKVISGGNSIPPPADTATTTAGLPPAIGGSGGEGRGQATSSDLVKAESLSYGDFYKKPEINIDFKLEPIELPINIKLTAANYYDVNRKINLDEHADNLNATAFSIIDDFSEELDETEIDFYDTYRYLMQKDLPVLITSDFLFYYFQNSTRNVFKEIEENIFYKNLWNINKRLYEVSLERYRARKAELGLANDIVLEGQRLETAYFAVALKLLEPASEQINKVSLRDDTKFNEQEAMEYELSLPEFLGEDVLREVNLIKQAELLERSPLFLYERDYSDFKVPFDYRTNAKLNNFYLTLKWLNSVFPLYYNDEAACPACLLDKNDWMISFAAAAQLAKDLSGNQELKNDWATIYKIVSFFTGLRQDLTYLEYNQVMSDLFGSDYKVEEIFNNDNQNRDNVLKQAQEKLSEFVFSRLEGTYERLDANRPKIGMRLLQEFYWPNEFIFDHLTGTDIYSHAKASGKKNVCNDRQAKKEYRCLGIGMDIVNLIYPLDFSQYFLAHTDFINYDMKEKELLGELENFDVLDWNRNIYWTTMDVSKSILGGEKDKVPAFMKSSAWNQEKELNTILGAWVNIHVGEDRVLNIFEQPGQSFGGFAECNIYNYVEPNLYFISDLISRTEMIDSMLGVLGISEQVNAATLELRDLKRDLQKILKLAEKELANEPLDFDDCKFITNLTTTNLVKEKHSKTFNILPINTAETEFSRTKIKDSIDGVKLVAVVYKSGDKHIIGMGPIFRYSEK